MIFSRESSYDRLIRSDVWRGAETLDARSQLLSTLEDTLASEDRSKFRAREQKQAHKYRSRELRVRSIEIYFRTGITAVLVGILGVAIFIGIAKGISPQILTQYLTPVSGLAGIAIGYFFGRGTETKQSKENHVTPRVNITSSSNDRQEDVLRNTSEDRALASICVHHGH